MTPGQIGFGNNPTGIISASNSNTGREITDIVALIVNYHYSFYYSTTYYEFNFP
jgi:hypothetical protein